MSSSTALVVRTKRDITIAPQGNIGQEVRSEVLLRTSSRTYVMHRFGCEMQKSFDEAQARRHANRSEVSEAILFRSNPTSA